MATIKVSKERIQKAAKENPCAAKVLETLFPEAFENNSAFCKIGSIFKRRECPNNIYTIFEWNGEIRILNISANWMWKSERNLKLSSLFDPERKTVTVSEFKSLSGKEDLSGFIFNVEVKEIDHSK